MIDSVAELVAVKLWVRGRKDVDEAGTEVRSTAAGRRVQRRLDLERRQSEGATSPMMKLL